MKRMLMGVGSRPVIVSFLKMIRKCSIGQHEFSTPPIGSKRNQGVKKLPVIMSNSCVLFKPRSRTRHSGLNNSPGVLRQLLTIEEDLGEIL